MSRRLLLGFCIIATLASTLYPQAATKQLYRAAHGTWTVTCLQSLVDNHRECGLYAAAPGRNFLAATKLLVTLSSQNKTQPPEIEIKEPMLPLSSFIFKVDDRDPYTVRCPTQRSGACIFLGADSNQVISSWRGGNRLIIRLTGMDGRPYDFLFSLADFNQALDDFVTQSGVYL